MSAKDRSLKWWGIAGIVAAVILIGAGILKGDYRDSLNRASAICWECIGFGQ